MTRKIFIVEILLTAAALAITAIAYPHLPANVPTHWDSHGRADGFGPAWKLFLLGPGCMAGQMLLTWLLPWLSPRNFPVNAFLSTYRQVMLMVFALTAYLTAILLWSAFGNAIAAGRALTGGLCLLIALLGNVMGKIRRNFYIGVRTPWTLANERVWNATHRFTGKLFVAGGLIGMVLVIAGLGSFALYAILAAALASILYSLVYYKQLERRGELDGHIVQEP
ncbi:MAG: SdpI family protein [Terracidiphilus sp.]